MMVLLVVKASMWPKYMWGEIIDSVYIYVCNFNNWFHDFRFETRLLWGENWTE